MASNPYARPVILADLDARRVHVLDKLDLLQSRRPHEQPEWQPFICRRRVALLGWREHGHVGAARVINLQSLDPASTRTDAAGGKATHHVADELGIERRHQAWTGLHQRDAYMLY